MISAEISKKIRPGAIVRVWEKIKEGDKERISKFEGMVLARKHGNEAGGTFTVRATVSSIGVEKIYPIHSPRVEKVEIISSPKKVRRAKLYYVRNISKREIQTKLGTASDK